MPETAWSPGFLLTCEIFLNGRFLAIAAPPDGNVEYQWFPHCVVRTQTAENLQFSTRMFLPSKHRAVVQSITVRNLSAAQRRFTLAFDMRGAVAKKTKPWFVNSPGEADNHVTWDAQRGCLLFEAQHSEIAAAQGFHPAPSRVEQTRMLHFDMELNPREQKELNFVLAIAENGRAAIELYDGLQARFADLEKSQRREQVQRTREKLRVQLREGKLDQRMVEVEVRERSMPSFEIITNQGVEEMDVNVKDMLSGMFGQQKKKRKMTVAVSRA